MPFPFLPLLALGVTSSMAALGFKTLRDKRLNEKDERNKTFSKYAVEHRTKEKTAQSLHKLKDLKLEIQRKELWRFSQIFENILHSELELHKYYPQDEDFTPLLTSAPLNLIDALGGTGEWFCSALSELQSKLSKANLELEKVVLLAGVDFRLYGPKEKEVTYRAYYLSQSLGKALIIPLLDEQGELRVTSIDEIEDLIFEHHEDVAA